MAKGTMDKWNSYIKKKYFYINKKFLKKYYTQKKIIERCFLKNYIKK